jgi:hypothetical protein
MKSLKDQRKKEENKFMKRILTHKDFVTEKIFQDQYADTINLKPGDVIYALEDFTEKDLDYSKMSKTKVGQIKQLNARNMLKTYDAGFAGADYRWDSAKKGDVLAVVLSSGDLAFKSNWSSNIKDRDDTIQIAYNILFNEGKIGIREYDKDNDDERKMVFNYNLNITYRNKLIVDFNHKLDFKATHTDFDYDLETDELIIKNGYSIYTGIHVTKKVRNASKIENDFSVKGKGKQINSI